jgi:hypothetical protein
MVVWARRECCDQAGRANEAGRGCVMSGLWGTRRPLKKAHTQTKHITKSLPSTKDSEGENALAPAATATPNCVESDGQHGAAIATFSHEGGG